MRQSLVRNVRFVGSSLDDLRALPNMTMEIHTRESVWDAVADDPEEAANLKLRSQLMDALESYIGQENITQTEAAKRFRVPRSRVSELVNGRISKFTIDKLVNMASRVGITTRLVVERSVRPRSVVDAPNAGAGPENEGERGVDSPVRMSIDALAGIAPRAIRHGCRDRPRSLSPAGGSPAPSLSCLPRPPSCRPDTA